MKILNAALQWRDDGLPYSIDYQDVYFSSDDAAGESVHVFLEGNRLRERWLALRRGSRFIIAELGFGSGLNFMQSVRLWQETSTPECRLHYFAFELHPLTTADMQRIHAYWPEFEAISRSLLGLYTDHSAGCHRLHIADNVILDLYYGDATELLQNSSVFLHCAIDCWFLDGFSPALNASLWQPSLLACIGELSKPGTTLSSYSVAGHVRQGLSAIGFQVSKKPGFGRKRHMLSAMLPMIESSLDVGQSNRMIRKNQPWLPPVSLTTQPGHAVIIGAGLAGCSTARSLAERGWRVTVLDTNSESANGASGTPQMALRCRLFAHSSSVTEFFTQAFLFANREFTRMQTRVDIGWQQSGVIQFHSALNRSKPFAAADLEQVYSSQVITEASPTELNRLAAIELSEAGWWLPLGGWLKPSALCSAYLAHPAITLLYNTAVHTLEDKESGKWITRTNNSQHTSLDSDVVVISNGGAARQLAQCDYLPLQEVRGQVTRLTATALSQCLRTVVNGSRTIFPADETGVHTLAASYRVACKDLHAKNSDDQENLQGASANFKNPSVLGDEFVSNRVAMRCNSNDRLPVIGQLARREAVLTTLDMLRRNARHQFNGETMNAHSLYNPGLYVTVAHGSNGLATCPLGAELLASLIANENLPCTRDIAETLSPIRFLVRALKRQRGTAGS